ncbi:MAG: MoxR family ATPase [Chloroflexi bacterium]|nr:MoxR family ATPase [Chloroflexota bacterium]MCY4246385.1 MoxR family ATPase [Chloroflexota bacterium]
MFDDPQQVSAALREQQYIATDEIATVAFLAEKLGKPLLVEGPAGVGKTELAKAWSGAASRPLIRLQCYEGLDESKALYEWEYAKQMLYTQLLRDKLSDLLAGADTLRQAADRLGAEDDVFFSERFLLARPLLAALTSADPAVLLIDEIDRADAEFEAFLLEILSDFQVSIPELGTISARHHPSVVLTSNNTRELSEALKRRCLYLFVDYPSHEAELNIVKLRVPGLGDKLARQTVEIVQGMRRLDLKKNPSVSETIDWAKALVMLNADTIDQQTLETTLTVLLKHESDVQKARRQLRQAESGRQPPRRRSDWN